MVKARTRSVDITGERHLGKSVSIVVEDAGAVDDVKIILLQHTGPGTNGLGHGQEMLAEAAVVAQFAHDAHCFLHICRVTQLQDCLDFGLGWCKSMAADVKSQKLDSVGHKQTIFRVCLETASDQHVEYLSDVLKVLNLRAAVHHNVVNLTLGAAHEASLLQLLQHDAAKYSG